jgi:hypothetical protein
MVNIPKVCSLLVFSLVTLLTLLMVVNYHIFTIRDASLEELKQYERANTELLLKVKQQQQYMQALEKKIGT